MSTTSCSRAAPRNGRSRTTWPPATGLHPVHIHFEEGRICRDGCASARTRTCSRTCRCLPEELGRRDVYPLPPQHRVVLRMRFRDFVGRYLIHCHNMNHEDDFMMVRWDIVDSVEELTRRRREIDERRMLAGLPPQYTHATRMEVSSNGYSNQEARTVLQLRRHRRLAGGSTGLQRRGPHSQRRAAHARGQGGPLLRGPRQRQAGDHQHDVRHTATASVRRSPRRLVEIHQALAPRMGRDLFMYSITLKPHEDDPAALKAFARHARRAAAGLDVPDRRRLRHRNAALRAVPAQPHQVRPGPGLAHRRSCASSTTRSTAGRTSRRSPAR